MDEIREQVASLSAALDGMVRELRAIAAELRPRPRTIARRVVIDPLHNPTEIPVQDGFPVWSVLIENPNAGAGKAVEVAFTPRDGRAGQSNRQIPPATGTMIVQRAAHLSIGMDPAIVPAGGLEVFVTLYDEPQAPQSYAFTPGMPAPLSVDLTSLATRLLGRVSRGVADSLQAGGRVVAPGIGAAIAALAAPPAGVYEILVEAQVGAGGVAADAGNMELRYGAAVQAVLAVPAPGGNQFGPFRVALTGAQAVSVNATGAATAGVPYAATIVATRIE